MSAPWGSRAPIVWTLPVAPSDPDDSRQRAAVVASERIHRAAVGGRAHRVPRARELPGNLDVVSAAATRASSSMGAAAGTVSKALATGGRSAARWPTTSRFGTVPCRAYAPRFRNRISMLCATSSGRSLRSNFDTPPVVFDSA